jgi:FkbM family methyltransferase
VSAPQEYVDRKGLIWQDGGPETDDHLIHGGHETALIEIARGMLPEGGVFVDVGAHVGLYTLNLADKAGVIYAVEANPKTYMVLRENINANKQVLKADIRPLNFAAWDRSEYLTLVDENGKETGGSTRCIPGEYGSMAYGCPLDTILSGERFDLVKIDVEGAEARVLKGMAHILVDFRPRLLIEMHDMYFGEQIRLDVLAILEALGYHWNDSLKFGGSYYIVAHPEAVDDFVVETVRAGQ